MAKKLKIKLLPDGTIQVETLGIKGKKCEDYIPLIEELTNAKVVSKSYTKEYNEVEEHICVQDETKEKMYENNN